MELFRDRYADPDLIAIYVGLARVETTIVSGLVTKLLQPF